MGSAELKPMPAMRTSGEMMSFIAVLQIFRAERFD
jgi:hypothetical protein